MLHGTGIFTYIYHKFKWNARYIYQSHGAAIGSISLSAFQVTRQFLWSKLPISDTKRSWTGWTALVDGLSCGLVALLMVQKSGFNSPVEGTVVEIPSFARFIHVYTCLYIPGGCSGISEPSTVSLDGEKTSRSSFCRHIWYTYRYILYHPNKRCWEGLCWVFFSISQWS